MTPLLDALRAALLHFVWQGALVAMALWMVLLATRRSPANVRYLASGAALGLMALLPMATVCAVYERPVRWSGAIFWQVAPAWSALPVSPRGWLWDLRDWALPLWAAGVAFFALRLGLASRHVALLRRAAGAAEGALAQMADSMARRMRVARPVRVLVSKLADAPSVVGWLRPAILIPAAALTGLDAAELEAILAHELAHIRRHDYLVNVLQNVIETLLFYHPAVWWVSARMRHERELCCDDAAVACCGDAVRYARTLTRLERMRVAEEPAVAANGGALLYRIQRLTGALPEAAPSRLPIALALIAAALCVPLAVHRARAQAPPAAAAPAPAPAPLLAALAEATPDASPAPAVNKPLGSVEVEVTVGAKGEVVDARVLNGPVELRKRALRFVLDRRFPAAKTGSTKRLTVVLGSNGVLQMREESLSETGDLQRRQRELTSFLEDQVKQARAELDNAALSENLEQLRANLQAQERKLAAQAADLEAQREQFSAEALNSQLLDLQRLLQARPKDNADIRERKAHQAEVDNLRRTIAGMMAGRTLAWIDGELERLPPGFQLPVKVGDTLTQDSIGAVEAALKAAQPACDAFFAPLSGSDAGLRIVCGHYVR